MATDTKGRRVQWGDREPRQKFFDYNEADYRAVEVFATHGDLTAPQIHEAIKHLRPDYSQTNNRLTNLYHGSLTQGPLLDRHPAQFNQKYAHARHIASRANPSAERILEQLGRRVEVPYTKTNSFPHAHFQATVGLTLELGIPADIYISRSKLIMEEREGLARTAEQALNIPIPEQFRIKLPERLRSQKTLRPDDALGIRIGDDLRACLIEIDRDTESGDGKQADATYFLDKLKLYELCYANNLFLEWFGFRRPALLIVTTNPVRARQILRHASRLDERLQKRLYVTYDPTFDVVWQTTDRLFTHLYEEPWETLFGPRQITEA